MLSSEEKAYCRALESLRKKDYIAADKEFKDSRAMFAGRSGMEIIAEATRLLLFLRQHKDLKRKTKIEIEEALRHGEETIVCGQGQQEEPDGHLPRLPE